MLEKTGKKRQPGHEDQRLYESRDYLDWIELK